MLYSLLYIGPYYHSNKNEIFGVFMKGKLFIISAPSGAGKTTLVQKVFSEVKEEIDFEWVVTYTTKVPRAGEKDGRDYHFISREKFDQLLAQGFFMEYSKAYTDYYGSPASVIEGLAQGVSFILIVDRVGAQEIIKKIPDAILVWIEVPSFETLRERLIGRGTDSLEKIERRLFRAKQEVGLEKSHRLYTYHLVNNDLNAAACELKAIIVREIGVKLAISVPIGVAGSKSIDIAS